MDTLDTNAGTTVLNPPLHHAKAKRGSFSFTQLMVYVLLICGAVVMIIPFIRAGEWIFGTPRLGMTATEIVAFVSTHPLDAISALWVTTLHALVAWLLFATATSLVTYPILVPVLRHFDTREEATP